MNPHRARIASVAALLAAWVAAVPAVAQTSEPKPAAQYDSRETRDQLNQVLQRVPPELATVLKLDPALAANQAYVAPYPELAAFLAEHPEIVAHPAYYFESVPGMWHDPTPAGARMTMDILAGLMGLTVFLVVMVVLAWLVKTFVAQRRWSHLSRVQTEAHNKLLDRLASSEELLAYIQSPAGKRFLEAAPIPVAEAAPTPRAPITRLLWSVQAGLVLVAGGIGLQLVSTGVPPGGAEPISALGILAISVGIGFVLSAIVAFVISRRLGLWSPPSAAGGGHGTGD
jgi:putative flippase GtrA